MNTVLFHELAELPGFNWDFGQPVVRSFIKLLSDDARSCPDLRMRHLCYSMLYCDVVVEGGRPLAQNFDTGSAGFECWYNFLRSLTFIGQRPNPDVRQLLADRGVNQLANLYGALESSGRPWEDQFELSVYRVVHDVVGAGDYLIGTDPAYDQRLPTKKRYDLRQQPLMYAIDDEPDYGGYHAYRELYQNKLIDKHLTDLVSVWADHHPNSYGLRNGFEQLCLWRWLQANIEHGSGRLYKRWTDQGDWALAGFVKSDVGWVFQTFWQRPDGPALGTAMLRHCLPLLPDGDEVFLTCPSTTGDPDDSRFEQYKKKFATRTEVSYSEFLAPFDDGKPPFYHTLRKEQVL